ncbi:hypothetical protein ND748_01145 [Frankia sp. AiPs1]|uniref:hypothetical protein n=1 Tax=Frankia sp. AiPs1 TaxID=573493 RepID=UPI0020430705|nr:hypothetical protein [Frankia sp. AiPs1]MCM3920295.1 hypothetical protein [Frankia sp. AiPs1]
MDLADADLVAGTSAGAIAGAILATGGDPHRLATLPNPSGLPGPQRRPTPSDGRGVSPPSAILGSTRPRPAATWAGSRSPPRPSPRTYTSPAWDP